VSVCLFVVVCLCVCLFVFGVCRKMGDRFKYDEWCPKESLVPKDKNMKERWLGRVGISANDINCDAKLEDLRREDFDEATYGQAYDDVEKDVGRAMWWFSTDEEDVKEKQQKLSRVLLHVVKAGNGKWSYYQGLHDIASVLILVVGETGAYEILRYIAANNLDIWLTKDVQVIVDKLIGCVYPLLSVADKELYDIFKRFDLPPVFCIGWVLTWFTHDVEDPQAAFKLIDSLVMCKDNEAMKKMVYLCGAIIQLIREDVLRIDKMDRNSLHFFFTSPSSMPPIVDDPANLPLTTDNKLRSALERQDGRYIKVDDLLRVADDMEKEVPWNRVVQARKELDEQKDRCENGANDFPKHRRVAPAYPVVKTTNVRKVVVFVLVAVVFVSLCCYIWKMSSAPSTPGIQDDQQMQQQQQKQ